MPRFTVRIATFLLAVALVAALPATAQIIPAGDDRWVTPGDGRTNFTFPAGDVESLCGADVSFTWNRTVSLVGVPETGFDWDTVVTRLRDANISSGADSVPIRVSRLVFRSIATQATPCGRINWRARATGNQPVTQMRIFNQTGRSGIFRADISVRLVFEATDDSGIFLGRLFYTLDLPDSVGVPWSFGPNGTFRPGIDDNENCIDVLRQKLGFATGDHVYFIEDLIAQGKCTRQT